MRTVTKTLGFLFCLLATSLFAQNTPVNIADHPVCGFDLINHMEDAEHPSKKQEWDNYLENVLPIISQSTVVSDTLITIPMVIHIVHSGEPVGTGSNLSDAQILAQVDELNKDFAALNSEFANTPAQWQSVIGNPNIQFCLATLDPDGNPTDGIDRQEMEVTGTDWQNNNINSEIKPALSWDSDFYFNVYVLAIPSTTPAGGVVGFANRPFTSNIGSTTDGIVVDHDWFGAPGFPSTGYRTMTHETGHYLGLPHPFNGSSCGSDDGIADTPNVEDATSTLANLNCANGYPTGPVSCGNEHMYINYMDYVNENCYTSFSAGQINVMRSVLEGIAVPGFNYGSREDLVNNSNFVCALAENDAGIIESVSPDTRLCTTEDITPVVTLRNFGTNVLTEVEIEYAVAGNVESSMTWTGNLLPGQNEEVTLPDYTPVEGLLGVQIFTSMPNGVADERMINDTLSFTINVAIPSGNPLLEDFETAATFPTPNGLFPINPDDDGFVWQLGLGPSGFGVDSMCVFFNNYDGANNNNPFGKIDALITPHFDLTQMSVPQLSFDVAYAEFFDAGGNLTDTLIVLAAVDCSPTFNQVLFIKGGEELSTADATADFFVPADDEWRSETIDLSDFAGETDISFALVNLSGWGNNVFLDNIQIGVACELELLVSAESALCADECSGSATVEAMGTGNLTYQWDANANNQTTATAIELCAGTYSVTVTSDEGCTEMIQVIVSEPDPITLTTSKTDETAFNANDGTATASASGGTGDLTYSWSNGQMTETATNLAPGEYTVTIFDLLGCLATETITINAFDCGNFLTTANGEDISCAGVNDGMAIAQVFNGSMPYTYLWSNDETSQTISNLASGTYSVTVTDANNCPATSQTTITEPTELTTTATSTPETANGADNGTATANPMGGTGNHTYLWNNNQTTQTISNLSPGEYSVTVTDENDCFATATITVGSFDCGDFSAEISSTNVVCFGQNNGTATVTTSGGQGPFDYLWSNGSENFTILNLAPNTYSVTVTDANDCELVLETTISQPTELFANASATPETGFNANNGTASSSATGGVPPLEYLWSNNQTTSTIQNLAPGSYTVTVSDGNDCEAIETVVVASFDCDLTATITSENASCGDTEDGSASVTNITGGVGPFDILWSTGSMDATITNLAPAVYQVTVTDADECEWTGAVEISGEDVIPPVVITQDVTIELDADGNANLTVEMIDNGSSDNCEIAGSILSQSIFNCDNLGENTVTLQILDTNGNAADGTATVTIEDNLAPEITSCPMDMNVNDCNALVTYNLPTFTDNCDATATLVSGFEPNSTFPAGVTDVIYEIADASGNFSTCEFAVTVDYDLELTPNVHPPSCPGFSDGFIAISVMGGVPPFFINFEGGGDPVDLAAGTYSVTVIDNNGCQIIDEVEVEDPEPLTYEFGATTPATNGEPTGSASIMVGGGIPPYAYQWMLNGSMISNEQNPMNLPPGDYVVIVIDDDGDGCTLTTETITIDNMVGTEDLSIIQDLKIFPNPTTGKLFIQISLEETAQIELSILDVTGKLMQPKEQTNFAIANQTFEMNLRDLANGVYWLRILVGEEMITKRVVILK